ncbi:NIPSNAP family protein [Rhizobium sp. BK456]|uniref:NIPSNAP family protein n=1 Tax=Rhizobium sp. BK456 TaxID=2587007 RepID=UPI00161CD4AA
MLASRFASYSSIVGKIHCVVQIWGYDSMEAYAASRAATKSDVRWRDYLRATPRNSQLHPHALNQTRYLPWS